MNYQKEATELLEWKYRQPWMNDADWAEFMAELDRMDIGISTLAGDLEKGVQMGCPVEKQIEMVKAMLGPPETDILDEFLNDVRKP